MYVITGCLSLRDYQIFQQSAFIFLFVNDKENLPEFYILKNKIEDQMNDAHTLLFFINC